MVHSERLKGALLTLLQGVGRRHLFFPPQKFPHPLELNRYPVSFSLLVIPLLLSILLPLLQNNEDWSSPRKWTLTDPETRSHPMSAYQCSVVELLRHSSTGKSRSIGATVIEIRLCTRGCCGIPALESGPTTRCARRKVDRGPYSLHLSNIVQRRRGLSRVAMLIGV